jgi:hypothetical protein
MNVVVVDTEPEVALDKMQQTGSLGKTYTARNPSSSKADFS